MKMNRKLLTALAAVLFAVSACFTACMTTMKQTEPVGKETRSSGVSNVALIRFCGPDQNINDQFNNEVYAAMKNMKGYNPVPINAPIPYEMKGGNKIPDLSSFRGYDYALTGEVKEGEITGNGLVQRGQATREMKTPGLTAAHLALPINSKARITNIENGKEVVVTITERISPRSLLDLG